MSSNELAIAVRGLSKEYLLGPKRQFGTLAEMVVHRVKHPLHRQKHETLWALRDVTFDVRRGGGVGISGRNGGGKGEVFKGRSRDTEARAGGGQLFGRGGGLVEG